jgi:hypothetical protein
MAWIGEDGGRVGHNVGADDKGDIGRSKIAVRSVV